MTTTLPPRAGTTTRPAVQVPPLPPAPPRRRRGRPDPAPPVPPLSRGRFIAAVAALCLAALAVWSVAYVFVFSGLEHARTQHQLYATFRSQVAQATAPVGGTIPVGTAVAVLTIPGAGLRGEVVVEGTTSSALEAGPGHVRTSPLPGQPGTSVIYGRAVSFGAPFAHLASLAPGSPVTVTTDQGTFHYDVTGIRQAGDAWTPALPPRSGLTLVTTMGGWTPSKVIYVDAQLNGEAVQDPGGRPSAITPAETIMSGQSDTLTLVKIVLWLQLLAVLVVALSWLASRWSLWQVWLVAVPAVLAVLWGTTNAAVALLPNLL